MNKIGEFIDAEAEEHETEGGDCCGGHEDKKFEIVDLERPLEGDCTLELIDFECPEGREVIFYFKYDNIFHIFSILIWKKLFNNAQGKNIIQN